jgi:predicted permease
MIVSLEVGLTVVFLNAGGLLLRSFVKLIHVDRGFESTSIITVNLSLPTARYPTVNQRVAFERAVLERVQLLPGVVSVGTSNKLLLTGEGANSQLSLEGSSVAMPARPLANIRAVNADYLRTFDIRLRSGRVFTEADGARRVAVISASTAEQLWPGRNPIGRHFRRGPDNLPLIEVVGVAADVRASSLEKRAMFTVYVPYWQFPINQVNQVSLAVKTAIDPLALSSPIRQAIRALDSELPIPAFRTMDNVVADSVAERRFQMRIVLLFAAAAIFMASIVTYGVLSSQVAQRTREIDLLYSVGAERATVQCMILGDASRLVTAGLVIGILSALAVGSWLRALLFDVGPQDATTLIGACVAVTAAATLAAFVPARRASRLDPMIALRAE